MAWSGIQHGRASDARLTDTRFILEVIHSAQLLEGASFAARLGQSWGEALDAKR
jgi:hypothetical protein